MQKQVTLKNEKTASPLFEKLLKYTLMGLIGAVGYYTLEVAFRGYSHFSMALLGAICMCFIYRINEPERGLSVTARLFLGAAFITVTEFIAGCFLNLWLGLEIWDYSHLPFNLFGQVSLAFSILWLLLNIPLLYLCRAVRQNIFGER